MANSAFNFEAVVLSDLPAGNYSGNAVARSLYVGFGGNIAVVRADGVVITLFNIPGGMHLPVPHIRINETGTDAGGLIAFF